MEYHDVRHPWRFFILIFYDTKIFFSTSHTYFLVFPQTIKICLEFIASIENMLYAFLEKN